MATLFAVLSALILVCAMTAVQGRPNVVKHTNVPVYDISDIVKKAKQEAKNAVLENVNKLIESYKENATKTRNLHPQIHDIIQKTVESHVKDRINDIIEAARQGASARQESHNTRDAADTGRRESQQHQNNHDRSQSQRNQHGRSENQQNHHSRSQSQISDALRQFQALINDVVHKVKDLKSKLGHELSADELKLVVESHLLSELDGLRTSLQHSVAPNGENNDSGDNTPNAENKDSGENKIHHKSEDRGDDIADVNNTSIITDDEINAVFEELSIIDVTVRRDIVNLILPTVQSKVRELQSLKQAFVNSKAKIAEAANKINSPGLSQAERFQLLAEFRSELNDMLLSKQQYIQDKALFYTQIRELLHNLIVNYQERTTSSPAHVTSEEAQAVDTNPETGGQEDSGNAANQADVPGETSNSEATGDEAAETSPGHTDTPDIDNVQSSAHLNQEENEEPQATDTSSQSDTQERSEDAVGQADVHVEPSNSEVTEGEATATSPVEGETEAGQDTAHLEQEQREEPKPPETNASEGDEEHNTEDNIARQVDSSSADSEVQSTTDNASSGHGDETPSSQDENSSEVVESSANTASNQSNPEGLKLAASLKSAADAEGSEGKGPIVIIIVSSCLVVCAAVGLLTVVTWKKHRRQRLYTRIPGGDAARELK